VTPADVASLERPRLAVTGIAKRFGATVALDDVSLAVRNGTVHALLGENGAGKTTLMRIAFGLLSADNGRMEVSGTRQKISSPGDAIAAGFGMVHQHFTNVPAMTVAENVALGGRGIFDANRAANRVREIGAATGLVLDPKARAGDLPVGAQQRLEIVKALSRRASLLILDEPTAVLAPAEAEELLRWLRHFADAGNAVVLITHKLREALATADDVTVLRRGRNVLAAPASELTTRSLTVALLGSEPDDVVAVPVASASADVVARAAHLSFVDERGVSVVNDVSLEVGAGEIVGIAAVEGSGQHELLRALAGRLAPTSGEISIPPRVGFVPEDRHRDALILEQTVTENIVLRGSGKRRGIIRWRAERERAADLMKAFDVRGGGAGSVVRSFSGGNQQKLVVGRELGAAPRLFVVENPTRGLDIRATRAVHDRLRDAAAAGAGVVVYSSDLDEVLAVASRVAVMYAGRLRESLHDRDAVGRAMLGVA